MTETEMKVGLVWLQCLPALTRGKQCKHKGGCKFLKVVSMQKDAHSLPFSIGAAMSVHAMLTTICRHRLCMCMPSKAAYSARLCVLVKINLIGTSVGMNGQERPSRGPALPLSTAAAPAATPFVAAPSMSVATQGHFQQGRFDQVLKALAWLMRSSVK
eukprot:scaffold232270_cov20-Tisochrysis_lutea.AAC.1